MCAYVTATGFERDLTSSGKWLSVRLRIKWLWVRIPLLSESVFIT